MDRGKGFLGRHHSEETKRRISLARIGKSMSEEVKRKISLARTGVSRSKETRGKISNAVYTQWAEMSPREKKERLLNTFLNSEAESKARATRALYQERTNENISKGLKRSWENLPQEEKDRRCKIIVKNLRLKPNQTEEVVKRYLEEVFPGEWAYNGDYSQGISIGRRIPDFVNVNGKKEVISVMGCLGLYHLLGDEEDEIAHYAKYGFRCIVLWEWDIWNPMKLENILKEALG